MSRLLIPTRKLLAPTFRARALTAAALPCQRSITAARVTGALRCSAKPVQPHSLIARSFLTHAVNSAPIINHSTNDRRSDSNNNDCENEERNDSEGGVPRWMLIVTPTTLALVTLAFSVTDSNTVLAEPIARPSPLSQSGSLALPHSLSSLAGDDYEIASWWRRLLAFLIDNSIISVMFQLSHTVLGGEYEAIIVPVISIVFNAGYEILSMLFNDGATLGKWALGIRVIRDDRQSIDWRTATVYWSGKLINFAAGADVIYGLIDWSGDHKCLHNVISGTVVGRKVKAEEIAVAMQQ